MTKIHLPALLAVGIATGAAADGVVTAEANDAVGSAEADDDVVTRRAAEVVSPFCADDGCVEAVARGHDLTADRCCVGEHGGEQCDGDGDGAATTRGLHCGSPVGEAGAVSEAALAMADRVRGLDHERWGVSGLRTGAHHAGDASAGLNSGRSLETAVADVRQRNGRRGDRTEHTELDRS